MPDSTPYQRQRSQPATALYGVARDTAPRVGFTCPWGSVDRVTQLAPGIVVVSTPSHGGIWLDAAHEARLPDALKTHARQYTPAPWYEEDCDALIPFLVFADELRAHLSAEHYDLIRRTAITVAPHMRYAREIAAYLPSDRAHDETGHIRAARS